LLGDPRGERVVIQGFTQSQVRGLEVSATSAGGLALKLMTLFFTKQEMAEGNCTVTEGREQLRPDIVSGIKCK